ncbi:MAG: hypothetical protein HFF74_10255 [Oscillospiraceae bacterium]|nr:hypothetical protein [Oscillospiraceae bacterium]
MDIQELRQEFIHYLKINYSYAHPEIMASNVLYVYYNDIGVAFNQIFVNEQSIKKAKEMLVVHFEEKGRKDPKGHASVHYGCWIKFKEFLDSTQHTL